MDLKTGPPSIREGSDKQVLADVSGCEESDSESSNYWAPELASIPFGMRDLRAQTNVLERFDKDLLGEPSSIVLDRYRVKSWSSTPNLDFGGLSIERVAHKLFE